MGGSAHFLFVKPISEREMWIRDVASRASATSSSTWKASRPGSLRIFIDSPRGITVDDCARAK